MALITLEQAIIATAGAAGVYLVATAWAAVTRSAVRLGLAVLGIAMVAAVAAYAVVPLR